MPRLPAAVARKRTSRRNLPSIARFVAMNAAPHQCEAISATFQSRKRTSRKRTSVLEDVSAERVESFSWAGRLSGHRGGPLLALEFMALVDIT